MKEILAKQLVTALQRFVSMECVLVTQNVIQVGNYTHWLFVPERLVRYHLNVNGILVLVESAQTVAIALLMKQLQNCDAKERDAYQITIASLISLVMKDFAVRVLNVALIHQIKQLKIDVKA